MTIDIKAIRARLDGITPPPWVSDEVAPTYFEVRGNTALGEIVAETGLAHRSAADATFIASAPSDIRHLLEEVERLRGLLAGATEIIATIHASADDESVGSIKVNMSWGRNYLPYTAERWLADAAKETP